MSSMITLGVSFLLFFIVLGFQFLIGVHLLDTLFDSMPDAVPESSWAGTRETVEENIKTLYIWTPPVLLLFACIKMLVNSASRGDD